jgi:predicted nuclease of predicted toxin-antitoxin system
MRFLIDECLHESLVAVAHDAGFDATHVNYLGLSGTPDWKLIERIIADEFTFVTNNRLDFLRLLGENELHAGLIILVPNVAPAVQQALFRAALEFIWGTDLMNSVIEVTVSGDAVRGHRYIWSGRKTSSKALDH